MKRIYLILCSLAVLLTACKDEVYDVTSISDTTISAKTSTADVFISVCNQDGQHSRALVEEFGVFISTKSDPTKNDERHSYTIEENERGTYHQAYEKTGGYGFTMGGLSANTTYYALPFISNKWGMVTGKVVSFTTKGIAKVTTKAATSITTTSVQLNATVEFVGEVANFDKRGFLLSTSSSLTINDGKSTNWSEVGKSGNYSAKFTNLQSSTRYYYRGYIIVNGETLYGDIMTFTTLTPDNTITLTVYDATDVGNNTAQLNGSITIGEGAVGQVTECGFIASTNNDPTFNTLPRISSSWSDDVVTWSGTKNLTRYLSSFTQNTLYYYRMFYKIGTEYIYSNEVKSFKTTGQTNYTVSEIMSVYNTLGLSTGQTSYDRYTVRGYVTKWNSGYPNYTNADFFIDDSPDGSTSLLKCFRLTGVKESDKRTLVVGDYIEAVNCHLMNYNGQAELKDGSFTVITPATPSQPTLSDYIGTYSCHAHRQRNNDYVDWDNVVVSAYSGSGNINVLVEGLIYGKTEYSALGHFDETNGYIHLYGGRCLVEKQCTINAKGDTLLNPVFYPMYINGTDTNYIINNSSDDDFMGEILLVKNSDGTLSFLPSTKADKYGRYANTYRFDYYRASDFSDTGFNTVFYFLDGTVLTKTSSSGSAPSKSFYPIKRVSKHKQ